MKYLTKSATMITVPLNNSIQSQFDVKCNCVTSKMITHNTIVTKLAFLLEIPTSMMTRSEPVRIVLPLEQLQSPIAQNTERYYSCKIYMCLGWIQRRGSTNKFVQRLLQEHALGSSMPDTVAWGRWFTTSYFDF